MFIFACSECADEVTDVDLDFGGAVSLPDGEILCEECNKVRLEYEA